MPCLLTRKRKRVNIKKVIDLKLDIEDHHCLFYDLQINIDPYQQNILCQFRSNNLKTFPEKLTRRWRLFRRIMWSILYNASLSSSRTNTDHFFSSVLSLKSFTTSINTVSVLWLLWLFQTYSEHSFNHLPDWKQAFLKILLKNGRFERHLFIVMKNESITFVSLLEGA